MPASPSSTCSRVLGGPYCTQILGDHGADVLKVEPPQGDETRAWGPPFRDGASAYFAGVNRNKRGLVLDLKTAGGREALLGLLAGADVLVENFKPGTMEALGPRRPDGERFPRLVHCRISGFGADGPLGGLPGYDAAVQALTGLMSDQRCRRRRAGAARRAGGRHGERPQRGDRHPARAGRAKRERPRPVRRHHAVRLRAVDPPPARGELARRRRAAGPVGQRASQYRALRDVADRRAASCSSRSATTASSRNSARCSAADLAADARFATNPARVANRVALATRSWRCLPAHEAEPLAARLMAGGVPAAPVLDVAQALGHPHTAHRAMIVDGALPSIASPVKLEPDAGDLPPAAAVTTVTLRPAVAADIPALEALIAASARALGQGYYTDAETEAAIAHVFGVNSALVADGSYLVAEVGGDLAGCGGWSARRTLFGGDRFAARQDDRLDPRTDAARVRAFFVAPAFARRGVAAAILTACEGAARAAGFTRAELMATLPGVPFYAAHGYARGADAVHDCGGIRAFVAMAKSLG